MICRPAGRFAGDENCRLSTSSGGEALKLASWRRLPSFRVARPGRAWRAGPRGQHGRRLWCSCSTVERPWRALARSVSLWCYVWWYGGMRACRAVCDMCLSSSAIGRLDRPGDLCGRWGAKIATVGRSKRRRHQSRSLAAACALAGTMVSLELVLEKKCHNT